MGTCNRSVKTLRKGDVLRSGVTITEVGEGSLSVTAEWKGETFTLTREPDESWQLKSRTELWSDDPEFRTWKMPQVRMWTPPKPRAYKPAKMSPGQEIKFRDLSGEWTAGDIWSDGPYPSTWWVVSDGETVLVSGRKVPAWKYPAGTLYRVADNWRDRIRRAENVRRRGVYPVVQETRKDPGYRREITWRRYVIWHADTECPDAQGKERFDGSGESDGYWHTFRGNPWDAGTIARLIMGLETTGRSPTPFCARCIALDEGMRSQHGPGAVSI